MPNPQENRAQWSGYDWSQGGDDWSFGWGSSRVLWFGTILPRVHFLLPAGHLLEIAPGYGRVTAFLLEHCRSYTGVDVTERCVAACRERFAGRAGARFELNDGASLEAVADGSVDAAVSWDSLVHVDPETMEAYVHGLARKLRPGARAFLHHSNLGAHGEQATTVPNPHWRDPRMTAELLRRFAAAAGLELDAQELVQWGSPLTNDCFSWLRLRAPGEEAGQADVRTHPSFGAEIDHCGWFHKGPGRGQA